MWKLLQVFGAVARNGFVKFGCVEL